VTAIGERIADIRLVVIVLVDITDREFVDAVAHATNPSSVQQVIADTVVSQLESIGYVRHVIATSL